jgi:hypothetical protein
MGSAADTIERLVRERAGRSDDEILREIEAIAPLPDEDDPRWGRVDGFDDAYRLVALLDVAATRRLRAAVPLVLHRACYGDPGEMMRGLRHSFEGIFGPDWGALAAVCVTAATCASRGGRLWAVFELGILREASTAPVVWAALTDDAALVRSHAAMAVGMLSARHPALEDESRRRLAEACARYPNDTALARELADIG